MGASVRPIYLIRHARPASAWGAGDGDPGLDEEGRAQARAACEALLAGPERPTLVVSSPLRRCLETAQPTAAALGVEIEILPSVGEIPTPAGLAPDQRPEWLRRAFGGEWGEIQGDLDYRSWRDSVAAALPPLGGAAVFTHFVALNAVVSRLEERERVLCFNPGHASITVLETDGAMLRLVSRGAEAATSVL
jgi:broad specificity phosphatase PhoE